MAKTMESEILEVYDAAKRRRNEDDQAYWARLVQASVEGTDEQWHSLNSETQEWINDGVLAKKQGRDYIPFPDAPPPPEAVVEKAPEEDRWKARPVKAKTAPTPVPTPAPEPVVKRRRGRPPAAGTAPTSAAPAPVTRRRSSGNGKPPGVYAQTQEYVVRNPNASTKDIMAALEKRGVPDLKQNTVQSVRGHTRDTLKLVQRIYKLDMGMEI